MNIKAVVIDDMDLARKSLIADLSEFCPNVEVLGDANGVIEGAKLIKKTSPELIFLDIEMGAHNGFDLIDIMGDNEADIIFVTGSKDYAIKAFQVSAIDYLLKPIDPDLLQKAVNKVILSRNEKENPKNDTKEINLSFHTSDEVRWAKSSEIMRLKADGNYTTIYFTDGSNLLVTKTLKEYDNKLAQSGFIRVHQSHLVNRNFIKSFVKTEGGYLLMNNDDQISVSVRKRTFVMEMLENLEK